MPDESSEPNQPSPATLTQPTESALKVGVAGVDPLDVLGSADDPAALVGQIVGERYHLVELLGKGGMGAVYRADHIHIRKTFALKVLHRELTHHAEAVKRFEREAIAAARIDHRNVATATDSGRLANGAFFLVLEYVQGMSLRQVLEVERRLSERRVAHIGSQVASALVAAHAAGIVHRDLKPDNVMLVSGNAQADFVKVLDFGVAKVRTEEVASEPALTRFGAVFGTPEYMSPEQALGHAVDARTDLYALGIVLYEMLVGMTPFADEQLIAVLTRQITEVPAPLPACVSSELARLIMQLLEKQPDARPPSAEQVLRRLEALVPQLATLPIDDSSSSMARHAAVSRSSTIESGDTLLVRQGDAPRPAARAETSPASTLAGVFSTYVSWQKAWLVSRVASQGVGFRLRRGHLLAAGLLVGAAVASVITSRGTDQREVSTKGTSFLERIIEDPQTKQLKLWMEQARAGDAMALGHLEERPETVRDAAEWAAIGAGRTRAKQWGAAVAAYARAFDSDADWARDARAHADLYLAALEPQVSPSALELAEKFLGMVGADLMYAVIEANLSGRAPKVDARKARSLLESDAMESQVSSALRVTLNVDKTRGCSALRALLPAIEADGDQRTHRAIQRKLSQGRGCGFLGLGDCYACVRGGKALAKALEASKARDCPTFLDVGADGASGSKGH